MDVLSLSQVEVTLRYRDAIPMRPGLSHQVIEMLPLLFAVAHQFGKAMGKTVTVESQVEVFLIGELTQNTSLIFLSNGNL